jgi:hypothetical protein
MIKKLLVSLFIISAVTATGVAATRALLSDQAVLSANTFSTGTVDLVVAKGQSGGSFTDAQAGFTETVLPGETFTNYFRLKNLSADAHFAIAAQASTVSGTISHSDVIVTFTPVNTSEEPVGSPVTKTLAEWESLPVGLGLPNIGDGDTQEYKIEVTVDEDVAAGGASITFDFVFTGTQIVP